MRSIATILLGAFCLFHGVAGELWAQTDTLTIVHINDTHSHLTPFGPKNLQGVGTMGGIARAVTLIGQVAGNRGSGTDTQL